MNTKAGRAYLILWGAIFLQLNWISIALADEPAKTISSGFCSNLQLADIPVGDFTSPPQMPESEMRLTQGYNNSKEEGYCNADDGSQPPSSDDRCQHRKIYYGHDGIDVHQAGALAGQNSVFAIQAAVVILSFDIWDSKAGWGETMILATRANAFSEEIITHHYHHLHRTGSGKDYLTTRRFNACEMVGRGSEIAKEGRSGTTAPHLHFSIRRWKNFAELQKAIGGNGKGLYGYGYSFGNDARLKSFLDPEGLLYGTFRDLIKQPDSDLAYGWALPYINGMRKEGIEFGLWDGGFGAIELVKRREAARWIKIAMEIPGYSGQAATFPGDLPVNDPDFTYVEALARMQEKPQVVNPGHSCYAYTQRFCPDAGIKRAEALKMVVLAFYRDAFMYVHDNYIWRAQKAAALALLGKFKDVNPLYWYSEYVYFGSQIGLVTELEYFNPEHQITRGEFSKWLMMGHWNLIHGNKAGICDGLACNKDQYCNEATHSCTNVPVCVPSETQICEAGGGYDPCENGVCAPGQTQQQNCNGTGTQSRTCNGVCQWGDWSACSAAPGVCQSGQTQPCGLCGTSTCVGGQWSACASQGVCAPGQVQQQNCNGTGTQSRTCNGGCQWDNWGQCSGTTPTCFCSSGSCCDGCNYFDASHSCEQTYAYQCEGPNAGQNAQQAIVRRYCTGSSINCDGQTQQFGWQTLEDCSSAQTCEMVGGKPTCVGAACQDQFLADKSHPCLQNDGTAGTPTICLEVQQVSQADWKFRACKQTGVFGSQGQNIKYRLSDANHLVQFAFFTEQAGSTCTAWHSFDVNYITGYGTTNAAGVFAEILSPDTCSQSSCTYRTGVVTIRKECN